MHYRTKARGAIEQCQSLSRLGTELILRGIILLSLLAHHRQKSLGVLGKVIFDFRGWMGTRQSLYGLPIRTIRLVLVPFVRLSTPQQFAVLVNI